ncbi:MAG: osmoprotectant transport system ATP-binding protein [Methylobacteriaceae bacterium]|nr:osmoprotectant transport system ATP-binding protein [Methylobacteriaceae bacterium]
MIEFDAAAKSYAGQRVLGPLTLSIPQGGLCVLVGPSGCGKSTTLKMINALIVPDAGTVSTDGTPVQSRSPEELRRGIGYVIQSGGLFPHWRVRDNIATVPRLLRWEEARIAARVNELAQIVAIDGALLDRFPHQLSGGQQQRIGVARALAADPGIILMDEPFGALDPVTRASLQTELARLHRETGKTIVFVTHDMDEALALGTMIVVMQKGEIAQSGTPAEILAQPRNDFVRDFVGGDDAALKLLEFRTIENVVRHGVRISGDAIPVSTTLRSAFARMMAEGRTALPVEDESGLYLGIIHIDSLLAASKASCGA